MQEPCYNTFHYNSILDITQSKDKTIILYQSKNV